MDSILASEFPMSASGWLWVLWMLNTALYYYVGRAMVSQPRHRHPRLFWNANVKVIALIFPMAGYIALVVAGFLVTDIGWRILAGSFGAYVLLAVRPRFLEP